MGGLTKRHVLGQPLRFWHVLFPSVLAHGTFDFQQMVLALEVWDEDSQNLAVILVDSAVLVLGMFYLWCQLAALRRQQSTSARSVLVSLVDSGPDGTAGQ